MSRLENIQTPSNLLSFISESYFSWCNLDPQNIRGQKHKQRTSFASKQTSLSFLKKTSIGSFSPFSSLELLACRHTNEYCNYTWKIRRRWRSIGDFFLSWKISSLLHFCSFPCVSHAYLLASFFLATNVRI